jgi:hypothetical protein
MQFGRGYFGWKGRVALNRIGGKKYQENGTFTERGEAAPNLEEEAP